MPKLLAALLFAAVLRAQTPAQTPAPEVKDPLGRNTPQQSIFNFLEACHARNYAKATYYLDLSHLSVADRAKNGTELAMQLEDLLDDTPFDISTLSRDPEGDLTDLTAKTDRLASFEVNGQMIVLQLERLEPRPGDHIWVVSAPSVALIPQAHQAVAETPFEKKLPQVLVTFEILDTPVWRWIALAAVAVILWFGGGFLAAALVRLLKPVVDGAGFSGPLRVALLAVGLRIAMEFASPATL
jgi:MscS family membrane protein